MIRYAKDMNKAVAGIGAIVGNHSPFFTFLAKNWVLTGFFGLAFYGKLRHRYKNGELTTYMALVDAGMIMSPLVGIAILDNLARQRNGEAASTSAIKALPAVHPSMIPEEPIQQPSGSQGFAGTPPPSFFATKPPMAYQRGVAGPPPAPRQTPQTNPQWGGGHLDSPFLS